MEVLLASRVSRELHLHQISAQDCFQPLQNSNRASTLEGSSHSNFPTDISLGECNTILSAYTLYRHLGWYCIHPLISCYTKHPLEEYCHVCCCSECLHKVDKVDDNQTTLLCSLIFDFHSLQEQL